MNSDSEDLVSDNPLVIRSRSYLKHKEHWYEEGNIAFLVGNTAFRLHGSVLSRRSSVIADMLSLPQPSLPNPLAKSNNKDIIIGGVPFIVLHDKAEDFAHVLDFIYPSTLPGVRTGHLDVHDLMGMVRLAGKYSIQDLADWAVSKLGREFLLRPDRRSVTTVLGDEDRYSNSEFCVQVIRFSRECSQPQFLPLAFYALATKDWDAHPESVTCLRRLTWADQCRIQEGRVALTKEVIQKAFTMPENHSSTAATKCGSWSCTYIRPTMWNDAKKRWENLILHPVEELEERLSLPYGDLCRDCKAVIKRRTQGFRDSLVQGLADSFRLG